MEFIKSKNEMQRIAEMLRNSGKKIGFVPTMGYLHEGHISLIREASKISDIVITSLFVNPTQFGPNEDFEKYPRDFDRDSKIAEEAGCDYLFNPEMKEIYNNDFDTSIEIGKVTENFEGKRRPGHFSGVATIVAKLFNITKPHLAVFGQKDYQQTLLIKKLVNDLNFDIDLIISPTIRENDGLAMSSRNKYLSGKERKKASILYKALKNAEEVILKGERNRTVINNILLDTISEEPEIRIDYASAALAEDLGEPDKFPERAKIVLLLAVFIGKTRLIDNSIVSI